MTFLLKKKKIIKEINFCSSYEEKLIYLIDIGKHLPLNNLNIRKKKNLIYGCQNNVWIKITNKNNKIQFNGDSESLIIKGIITIIISIYNNKKPKNILQYNVYNFLKKLNVLKYFVINRIIGIKSIILYIKKNIKLNN